MGERKDEAGEGKSLRQDASAPEPGSRISRRQFMVAAGLTVGGAAIPAQLASAASGISSYGTSGEVVSMKLPKSWDREADVVVVGSGGAGLNAAITAAAAGRKVLILERAPLIGGTTLKSGSYWIPNNPAMRAKGLTDPRDWALKYMARLAYPSLYDAESPRLGLDPLAYDLIATFYDRGSEMISYMDRIGAFTSKIAPGMGQQPTARKDIGDPDYHADLPEDKAPYGRSLSAETKGTNGKVTLTNSIIDQQAWITKHKVPILYNQRVVGVFLNSKSQVVGVQVESGNSMRAIRAKRAVVFGSGGFTQDPIKSVNYLRGPIWGGCGVPTNTGDLVDIGLSLGAQFGNMNNAFWVQNIVDQAIKFSSVPNEVWIPYGDSMIYVNKFGKRFVNEKMVYNERTQSHFHWEATPSEYTQLIQFMIWDSAVAQDPTQWAFRFGNVPMPGQKDPSVISGQTWNELATNINARLQSIAGESSISGRVTPLVKLDESFVKNIPETVSQFNSYAAAGVDPDFGRGTTPIQIAWSGPPRKGNTKNPTMYPMRTSGPYYALMLGGGTLDTKGGPVINTKAQILHVSGNVIPGLYGCGNCIASPAGQAYWSAGSTVGPGLTYGYIAGQNAAKEPVKQLTI
jgi:3-oxosteroid 1-dehydrogenase